MYKKSAIQTALRLLRKGQSYSSIAAQLGLSQETVGALASGWRPEYKRGRPPKNAPKIETTPDEPSYAIPAPDMDKKPERCPTCGCVVYMPCVLCNLKRWQEHHKPKRHAAQAETTTLTLGVNLHGAAKRRYEAIRRQKELEADRRWREEARPR